MTKTTKAMADSKLAHQGEKRKTGEEFYSHPKRVYEILKDVFADDDSMIAGLLHDTVEHGKISLEYIEVNYGHDIAYIVDAVTRREGETRMENWARLEEMSKKDERVIEVKMADRLSNLETIEGFDIPKRKTYCEETEYLMSEIFSWQYNASIDVLGDYIQSELTFIKRTLL